MKRYVLLASLFSSMSLAAVVMIPEITPDPDVSLVVGQTMEIDFLIDSDLSFYGAVEWVGVGELSDPVYPYLPGIIPPPIPPYEPDFLPDNMWPIFYDNISPAPLPFPFVFAITTYFADESGSATINLYDFGMDFSEFTLIDSFSIVVTPEPCTLLFLGIGGLALRRKLRR